MFHDNDQYTLRKEIDRGGFTHYFISHTDAHGESHDTKVPRTTFAAYLRFEKDERNLRRWDERYRTKLGFTDAVLYGRTRHDPRTVENMVIAAEQGALLRKVIAGLPEVQRRRWVMYREERMTFEEIATVENCKKQSVCESVQLAERAIKRKFRILP